MKYLIIGLALVLSGCYQPSPESEPTNAAVYGEDYTLLDNGAVEPINHSTDVIVPDE